MKKVKLFEQFISEDEFFKGGMANGMTAQDLADKHDMPVAEIEAALEKGQKVELEHTEDKDQAYEIAKDHIFEDPKYYDKLAKIEGDVTEGVKVVHNRYIASHGKAPKGFGKWAFSYDKKGDDPIFVPTAMSFTDAVKWIKAKAVEDKKDEVFVMEGINDFSPMSYAKKVANKAMSLAAAAKETGMSQVELLKLVRRFDKNFKMYEAGDHEVGMAQNQLDAIINAAMDLQEKIGSEEINLPGWIQDHISQSYNFIKQANDGYHTLGEDAEVNERLKVLLSPLMTKIMKNFSHSMDPALRAELNGAIQAAVAEVMKKNDIIVEGTFSDGEIAIYDDPRGDAGETRIYKRGKGYYGQNDSFDFEAKDKKELEKKLKSWGYELIAGSIDEAAQAADDWSSMILSLLAQRDQAHIFHWQSKTLADHEAFGDFYEDYLDGVDVLVEMMLGASDKKPVMGGAAIQLVDYSDASFKQFVDETRSILRSVENFYDKEQYPEIVDQANLIIGLVDKLSYLIKLQ